MTINQSLFYPSYGLISEDERKKLPFGYDPRQQSNMGFTLGSPIPITDVRDFKGSSQATSGGFSNRAPMYGDVGYYPYAEEIKSLFSEETPTEVLFDPRTRYEEGQGLLSKMFNVGQEPGKGAIDAETAMRLRQLGTGKIQDTQTIYVDPKNNIPITSEEYKSLQKSDPEKAKLYEQRRIGVERGSISPTEVGKLFKKQLQEEEKAKQELEEKARKADPTFFDTLKNIFDDPNVETGVVDGTRFTSVTRDIPISPAADKAVEETVAKTAGLAEFGEGLLGATDLFSKVMMMRGLLDNKPMVQAAPPRGAAGLRLEEEDLYKKYRG